ncbi:hypothetical protein B0H15DRAFT_831828 [Mycena belliarum]|uniref:TPX2 C-terminal domain-containing protein n=1 Tax=Mycena belliarum TaxID=1033014 RepID=A0AAD6UA86_9AGAR|nr:hypothetical protein B0H15DRAFT_831828 [Mycena belliae]
MRAPWDSGSMHDGSGADKREGHEMKSTSARAPSASLMQSTRSVASTSTSTSTSTNKPYKIPDFAALHAVQAAHFAALRASTAAARAPTVSVAPHLSTDVRAAERAKFEGALREREAERERERERERGEREEKEREEEKEARRKAVVKAHGVPEWYRDAPKRAGGGAE